MFLYRIFKTYKYDVFCDEKTVFYSSRLESILEKVLTFDILKFGTILTFNIMKPD